MLQRDTRVEVGIWLSAFGYFACYVPYSAVAKALSEGLLPGVDVDTSGLSMLPVVALAALSGVVVAMFTFGWWGLLQRKSIAGFSIPVPSRVTFASGLATAVTGIATTLAYTLDGVSIVFMMLLMRGGVLAMAPLIDLLTRRRMRWYSIGALILCICALVAAFFGKRAFELSTIAIVDVSFYLAAYFVRLQWMSRAGKVDDPAVRRRYFVEEQLVSSTAIVLSLAAFALFGTGVVGDAMRQGFRFIAIDMRFFYLVVIGLAALGTGIFGARVLLDPRENSFAVPVNRSSSIVSGMVATLMLALAFEERMPTRFEWLGFAFIVGAVLMLTLPSALKTR